MKKWLCIFFVVYFAPFLGDFLPPAVAQEGTEGVEPIFLLSNIWVLISAFLVFIMHLGFAALESGLSRSKNTVNIMFKNLCVVCIGILTYALVGFNLMFPGDAFSGAFFGSVHWGLSLPVGGLTSAYHPNYDYWTDFFRQALIAATTVSIVSGAVAERMKFHSFLIFSALYLVFVYPMIGMWTWGGGWLNSLGFHDLAGSTVVHCVGGWGALAGAILVGPRKGKYIRGGIHPIHGHNLPMAGMGVFLLWFGWFGFNGGSAQLTTPGHVSYVIAMTALSASAGVVGAMIATMAVHKRPEFTMVLNGCLGGLVGITAGADVLSPTSTLLVGFISGILVVFSIIVFDKNKVDDPVGAISVHLVCGIWGTLAVGIWGQDQAFFPQFVGVICTGVFCFLASFLLFGLGKLHIGLRVSEKAELRGLDISQHGAESYNDFQIFPR